jgi:hypothetical protein
MRARALTPILNVSSIRALETELLVELQRARVAFRGLVSSGFNERLNQPEFKTSVRSLFEGYQLALRRVIQARQQTTLLDGRESAAS